LAQLEWPSQKKPYRSKTYSMGYPPRGSLDKALEIAAALEDMDKSLEPQQ
jgi:hypothetical protein